MAEEDIDTIAALADGVSNWGAAMRGAMTTLKERRTDSQVAQTIHNKLNGARIMQTQAHTANGLLTWNWANLHHKRITSAGFNITGISESGAPTGDTMSVGIAAVFNTHGSTTINVDFTGYGADAAVNIPAGESEVFIIFSVPAPA